MDFNDHRSHSVMLVTVVRAFLQCKRAMAASEQGHSGARDPSRTAMAEDGPQKAERSRAWAISACSLGYWKEVTTAVKACRYFVHDGQSLRQICRTAESPVRGLRRFALAQPLV